MEAYAPITVHTTHVESQMENERGGKQRTDTVTSSLGQCWLRHLSEKEERGEEREAQSATRELLRARGSYSYRWGGDFKRVGVRAYLCPPVDS